MGNSVWENKFSTWSDAPSQTQKDRCDRAVLAVKKAVAANAHLDLLGVDVFAQGSYANRTNVKLDSDVDVCIRYDGEYFPDFPSGLSLTDIGHRAGDYSFSQYKNDVQAALVDHFGARHVSRGKKAFDIHENSYRIDADAVPCLEYRKYYRVGQGQVDFHRGIALLADGPQGKLVTNFPTQQYENGVAKNDATSRRFKGLTRIVKTLRNDMLEGGRSSATPIPSFLIESLVWAWPNANFNGAKTWHDMSLQFFTFVWNATRAELACNGWMEINNLKRLFGPHNPWTAQQVNAFAADAYFYIGGK